MLSGVEMAVLTFLACLSHLRTRREPVYAPPFVCLAISIEEFSTELLLLEAETMPLTEALKCVRSKSYRLGLVYDTNQSRPSFAWHSFPKMLDSTTYRDSQLFQRTYY